jgi:hypothetical protein
MILINLVLKILSISYQLFNSNLYLANNYNNNNPNNILWCKAQSILCFKIFSSCRSLSHQNYQLWLDRIMSVQLNAMVVIFIDYMRYLMINFTYHVKNFL